MTVFKLVYLETLEPGEMLLDKEEGIIYCKDSFDWMKFMKEYNDEEYPDCNIRLYLPEKLKNEEINTTQIKPGDWVVLPDKHSAKVTEVFKDDGGTTAKVTTCYFIDDLEVN